MPLLAAPTGGAGEAKANPFASFGAAKVPDATAPKANPFGAFAGTKAPAAAAFGGAATSAAPAFGGAASGGGVAFGGGVAAPAFGSKSLPQPTKASNGSPKLSPKATGAGGGPGAAVVREAHFNQLNQDFVGWLTEHVKSHPGDDFSKNFEHYLSHAKVLPTAATPS